ncbi:hypothetical protein ACJX0J_036416, partial [Zea mays]
MGSNNSIIGRSTSGGEIEASSLESMGTYDRYGQCLAALVSTSFNIDVIVATFFSSFFFLLHNRAYTKWKLQKTSLHMHPSSLNSMLTSKLT